MILADEKLCPAGKFRTRPNLFYHKVAVIVSLVRTEVPDSRNIAIKATGYFFITRKYPPFTSRACQPLGM